MHICYYRSPFSIFGILIIHIKKVSARFQINVSSIPFGANQTVLEGFRAEQEES
jgi:hypothetical protein